MTATAPRLSVPNELTMGEYYRSSSNDLHMRSSNNLLDYTSASSSTNGSADLPEKLKLHRATLPSITTTATKNLRKQPIRPVSCVNGGPRHHMRGPPITREKIMISTFYVIAFPFHTHKPFFYSSSRAPFVSNRTRSLVTYSDKNKSQDKMLYCFKGPSLRSRIATWLPACLRRQSKLSKLVFVMCS
ncbi:hypothetical protein B9Z55_023897 [Caenorhabditis nigoni]|uniref:Uncharacterized protein n=1 Tax=Caenorhabditis nigoni TaxID=1611254 RepID=A0A2G5SRX8_9PELO|nr:hypothetical protein B9Z55_023897 [Caenorhabditis nigoni]